MLPFVNLTASCKDVKGTPTTTFLDKPSIFGSKLSKNSLVSVQVLFIFQLPAIIIFLIIKPPNHY